MWFTLLIQRVTAPKRESSISQASTSCFFALSKSRRPFLIPCTKRQELFSILTGQIHVVDDVFIWKPAPAVGGQNTLRHNPDLFFLRQPVSQHLCFGQINGDICSRQGEVEFNGFHCPVPRSSCQIQKIAARILHYPQIDVRRVSAAANLPRMPATPVSIVEPGMERFRAIRIDILQAVIPTVSVEIILLLRRFSAAIIRVLRVAHGTKAEKIIGCHSL